jgi:hypothetical protein
MCVCDRRADTHPPSAQPQYMAPAFFFLVCTIHMAFFAIALVTEKERMQRLSLRVVGLRDSVYWLSWILTFAIMLLVSYVIAGTVALSVSTPRPTPAHPVPPVIIAGPGFVDMEVDRCASGPSFGLTNISPPSS